MDIKRGKLNIFVRGVLLSFTVLIFIPIDTVYGVEDPSVGTTDDNIENMIEVGKTLINKTPYVYGGGHSDWSEQKGLELPTGLDNSSYVAWVLYRGMGVDMGLAPIAGNYDQYFGTISVGSLEGVERGDLIADDHQIEIYLGESEDGTHYSLSATNDRNNVAIIETNWGNGVDTKEIIRPSIAEAKSGTNGLTYDGSVVLDGGIGEGAIGGDTEATRGTTGEGKSIADGVGEGTEAGEEKEEDKESAEEAPKGNKKGSDEDLFSWLNPIVDFTGGSDSHAKSEEGSKKIDGSNKGLEGHQSGFFDILF